MGVGGVGAPNAGKPRLTNTISLKNARMIMRRGAQGTGVGGGRVGELIKLLAQRRRRRRR